MAEEIVPQVQACRIRIARLDSNGVPSPGANNLYTGGDLTELTATPVYSDADEITVKNACGDECVNYFGDDSFTRADISLTLCSHTARLMQMLGRGDVLTDADATGWAAPPIGRIGGNGVSIEVWAKRILDGDLDPDYPYAWWVFPKVRNLRFGEKKFENGASLPVFTGRALQNLNWFDGPLNDWPVASDRVWQWIPTEDLPAITGMGTIAAS